MEQYLLFHQLKDNSSIFLFYKKWKSGNVTLSQDTCNLTITGTSERINALTNEDIKVYANVGGLKKGRHNVKLEVELSDSTLSYRLDSDEQIRVNIKK